MVLLALPAILGCTAQMPVPAFDLEVTLSAQAREKFGATGDAIKVIIYFDGDGVSRPGENTAPFRAVYLGKHEVELRPPSRIRISDAKISKEAVGRLSDTNYYFTVNVVSGRRALKDGVLDCVTLGRASDLSTTSPVVVRCDLLEYYHRRNEGQQ